MLYSHLFMIVSLLSFCQSFIFNYFHSFYSNYSHLDIFEEKSFYRTKNIDGFGTMLFNHRYISLLV